MWLDRALDMGMGGEPWTHAARGMRAMSMTLSGDGGKALALFHDLPRRAAMVPPARADSLTYRGLVKLWTGDLAGAMGDLTEVVSRITAGLQVRFPGQPLAYLAEAEFRSGHWDDSQGHAELAVSLARELDWDYDLTFVHSAAAQRYRPAAVTGRVPLTTLTRPSRPHSPSAVSPRSLPRQPAASSAWPATTRPRRCAERNWR